MLRAVNIVRLSTIVTSSDVACKYFTPNTVYTICIRWKRKPIWLPTAKSKVFRIPPRPTTSIEEMEEMKRLSDNYRTLMKSITKHIGLMVTDSEAQFEEDAVHRAEEKDFEQCSFINDEWNKTVAQQREKRIAQEQEARKAEVLQRLTIRKERDILRKTKIEKHVKHVQKQVQTFITPENIDHAIDEALAHVTDYNVAIDLNGKFYPKEEDDAGPENTDSSQRVQASQ